MRTTLAWMLIAVLAGCKEQAEESDCEAMCQELAYTCEYAAFPSYDSCVQGCTYNADQGADVKGQLQCVQDAACDTFAIVECEHGYGVE